MELTADGPEDYVFKIIIAGNTGVGKSAISRRYFKNTFNETLGFTIGVEFDETIIKIRDSNIKVQLWDCSGKASYSTIAK